MNFTSKILIALTIIGNTLSAQNAVKWIPSDAFVATGLKIDRLKADLKLSKTTEREFYKAFTNKITESSRKHEEKLILSLLETPEKYNVNALDGAAGFVANKDSLYLGGCFFGLTNSEKIEQLVDSLSGTTRKTSDKAITKELSYFITEDIFVAWNSTKVLIGGGKIMRKNQFSFYSEKSSIDKEVQRKEYFEQTKVYLHEIFANKSSLPNTANYKAFSGVKKDLWFFTDYSKFMGIYSEVINSSFGIYRSRSETMMMNSLQTIYNDMIYVAGLNFNESNLVIDFEVQQGEKLKELTTKIYDRKLNKKFFKYLPSSTVGFVSIAINVEETINGMFELYKPLFAGVPRFGQKAKTVIELIQLALDEEGIGSILQGDMIFAVHDIPVADKEVKEYVMDANYNYTDTTFIKRKMDPKFVVMATIGKEESFDILLRGLMAIEGAEVDNNKYKIRAPRSVKRTFGELTLLVHDGIAFFTNDDKLIDDVILKGGYPKNQQIEKRLQKMAKKSPTTIVFDPSKIINGMEETLSLDSAELILLNSVKNLDASVEITTSGLKKKIATSQIVVKNANSNTSIGHALNIMDAFYQVEQINRAKWNHSSAETATEAVESVEEEATEVDAPAEEATEEPILIEGK